MRLYDINLVAVNVFGLVRTCFVEMSDHIQYCSMFKNAESDELFENENIKESDELLIDAVRAYPHLYNHQDRNFKDNLMKENSWKEIALTLNMSGK